MSAVITSQTVLPARLPMFTHPNARQAPFPGRAHRIQPKGGREDLKDIQFDILTLAADRCVL